MTKKEILQKSMGLYFNTLAYLNPKKLKKDGFVLFCNPFARRIKPHQMEFLDTAEKTVLKLENHDIQTYKWGNGDKKVLLIHGWASHSFRWKAYIESLTANNYTVYALDAPAHGLSSGKMIHLVLYAKVIHAFLEQNKSVKQIVCHSVGGFATTYFLNQFKNNSVEKVVIMGAPGEASDFFEFYQQTLGLSNKALQLIINEFETQLGKPPSFFSSIKLAETINIPALIVHDKGDMATNYKNSIKLNQHWKNSKLILTEDLGHDLKSDDLIKEVVEYLEQN